MQQLAAENKKILESLRGLTTQQKNAVIALMTITRGAAAYESRFLTADDPSLRAFYDPMRDFSPAYKATGKFQSLLGSCFNETVACLRAQKECREASRASDCDTQPAVIEACANEMICFTREFKKLFDGIPGILGGRDPWPPQLFPY